MAKFKRGERVWVFDGNNEWVRAGTIEFTIKDRKVFNSEPCAVPDGCIEICCTKYPEFPIGSFVESFEGGECYSLDHVFKSRSDAVKYVIAMLKREI